MQRTLGPEDKMKVARMATDIVAQAAGQLGERKSMTPLSLPDLFKNVYDAIEGKVSD